MDYEDKMVQHRYGNKAVNGKNHQPYESGRIRPRDEAQQRAAEILADGQDCAKIHFDSDEIFNVWNEEDDDDEHETCQELLAYAMQKSEAAVRPGTLNLKTAIDKIDPKLVARLDVNGLWRAVRCNNICHSRALERGFYTLLPQFLHQGDWRQEMMLKTDEQVQKNRVKKRINETPNSIHPQVSAALRYLARASNFLHLVRKDDPKSMHTILGKDGTIRSHCGAFFVKKSNGTLRVIMDGRWANVYFDGSFSKFEFFSFETLSNVISNLSRNDKWYAANFDLRHWFHQIPLPAHFKQYLGMNLRDRQNREDEFWAFPRSIPMGWILAPFLAQCCAWGLAVSGVNNSEYRRAWTDPEKRALDEEYLANHKDRTTPHSWIPLKGGGGIFIFPDNILAVTAKKSVAEWWYSHIIRECKRHGAALKGPEGFDPYELSCSEQEGALRKSCFVELCRDDPSAEPASFEFLGVHWHHHHKRIKMKDSDRSTRMPGEKTNGSWAGSHRDMAGILGKLLWFRRVHGMNYYDPRYRFETNAILTMYQSVTPKPGEKWDSPLASPPSQVLEGLKAAWKRRAACPSTPLIPEGDNRSRFEWSEVLFAIVDAATGSDETKQSLAGGVWYEPPADGKAPTVAEVNANVAAWPFRREDKIAIGEMDAILGICKRICQEIKSRHFTRAKRLIVLATDNLSCKFWVEKGHARTQKMQDKLNELHEMLHRHGVRLYLVYVPSADNFADEISRIADQERMKRELSATKLECGHRLLERAFKEVNYGLWSLGGGDTGGIGRREN